jgi:hypothetical protein
LQLRDGLTFVFRKPPPPKCFKFPAFGFVKMWASMRTWGNALQIRSNCMQMKLWGTPTTFRPKFFVFFFFLFCYVKAKISRHIAKNFAILFCIDMKYGISDLGRQTCAEHAPGFVRFGTAVQMAFTKKGEVCTEWCCYLAAGYWISMTWVDIIISTWTTHSLLPLSVTWAIHDKKLCVKGRWQDDVIVDNIKSVGRAWTALSGSGWGQIAVKAVVKLRVAHDLGKFLTSWGNVSFSKRTLPRGV